jgi:glutamate 5-kinase
LQLLDKKSSVVCTHFVASSGDVSSVKKWIAHSEGFAKGEIHVNENAAKVLVGEKAVSLLPIGATQIVGDFEKDDIVRIFDQNGLLLGVGKVQYDSEKARAVLGRKNQKPLVHCDYLYLEQ